MKLNYREVKKLTDIEKDDIITITGDRLKDKSFKVQMVKTTKKDGVEIIFNLGQNLFFNLGMYLEGKSWVKECKVCDSKEKVLRNTIQDIYKYLDVIEIYLKEEHYHETDKIQQKEDYFLYQEAKKLKSRLKKFKTKK